MSSPRSYAIGLAVCSTICLGAARADADCGDGGAGRVALTSGLAIGMGAAAALVTSGVLVAADDTREFKFGVGAGVGIGVTAGITAIYAVVDASSQCAMVTEADGIVWTIPIVAALLGALLPVAVWGAADKVGEPEDTTTAALRGATWMGGPGGANIESPGATPMTPGASVTFRF
jgi:hypothetical protein